MSRIPGIYQDWEYVDQPGGINLSSKVLLIGMRLADASADHDLVPQKIRTRSESQLHYGAGSQLDLMFRAAFATGELARLDRTRGGTPELWGMAIPPLDGIDDDNDDVAAQAVTITGTATNSGTLIAYINDLVIRIPVRRGQNASDIAQTLLMEIRKRHADLGYTAARADGRVTLTARTPGRWGEELYMALDITALSGVQVQITRTASGQVVPDIETALDASMSVDHDCIVVPTGTAGALEAVKAHVERAWQPGRKRYRIVVVPIQGTLDQAVTATAALNERTVMVTCAEKTAGATTPYDPHRSSRSHAFEVAASVGTRLYTQSQVNYNYNSARLPVCGRPATVDEAILEEALDAGVCVILKDLARTDKGYIVDPISSYRQHPDSGAPDTRWQPIEIPRVVQTLSRTFDAALALFPRGDASPETAKSARATVGAVLESAARLGMIAEPDDDAVEAGFRDDGAASILSVVVRYQVVTGLDIVEVSSRISR